MAATRSLLDLPNEVLQLVLENGGLDDLGRLSCTCSTLNAFIKDNTLLFRELYLRRFDDPRRLTGRAEASWEAEVTKVVRLEKLLISETRAPKSENLIFIGNAIASLLSTATPRSLNPKGPPSRNVAFINNMFDAEASPERKSNIDSLLCSSSIFEHAGDEDFHVPANTREEKQMSAKLHCLYGVPVCLTDDDGIAIHPYARAKVYDLRRYTTGSLWGPFQEDGSQEIDWERMESIMVDLAYNLELFDQRTDGILPRIFKTPWGGATPNSYVSAPRAAKMKEPTPPVYAQDPYGVTGTWMRIVCFLDYSELFAYNFAAAQPPPEEDRPPLVAEEATRLIGMRLWATKIESPSEEDGQGLPVVHFRGKSRSLHSAWDPNANSDIRGVVRLTPQGEVRWTTWSIYHGEERWRSEGIQIGGIRSSRGVLGNWFDKDYDEHGPAGPTGFWKITDELDEPKFTASLF